MSASERKYRSNLLDSGRVNSKRFIGSVGFASAVGLAAAYHHRRNLAELLGQLHSVKRPIRNSKPCELLAYRVAAFDRIITMINHHMFYQTTGTANASDNSRETAFRSLLRGMWFPFTGWGEDGVLRKKGMKDELIIDEDDILGEYTQIFKEMYPNISREAIRGALGELINIRIDLNRSRRSEEQDAKSMLMATLGKGPSTREGYELACLLYRSQQPSASTPFFTETKLGRMILANSNKYAANCKLIIKPSSFEKSNLPSAYTPDTDQHDLKYDSKNNPLFRKGLLQSNSIEAVAHV